MATKDLRNNIDTVLALEPKARTSSATSSAVDLAGYDSAMVEVQFGAVADGTQTPSLQHSVDGTTYTDAGTDGYLDGTFVAGVHTTNETSTHRVGYKGPNRYLKTVLTNSGSTTTGGVASVSVVRGHPALAPLA